MALVLSLKVGDDIYIGDERLVLTKVYASNDFHLEGEFPRRFVISDAESIEVQPDVFVSAGANPPMGTVRVVIDAPRDILILRGEKLRS